MEKALLSRMPVRGVVGRLPSSQGNTQFLSACYPEHRPQCQPPSNQMVSYGLMHPSPLNQDGRTQCDDEMEGDQAGAEHTRKRLAYDLGA